jgi:hypothetical protein
MGDGREGVRESIERLEQTKVKCTHSGVHQDIPSNIYLEINNERRDCKIGAVGGYLREVAR